jgi:hypothetical protein
MIKLLHNLALFWGKKANFFAEFFSKNILKNHDIGPGDNPFFKKNRHCVKVRDKICGDYLKLNLDRVLFIGGVPKIDSGIVVYENFSGCVENMLINFAKVAANVGEPSFEFKDNFNSYGKEFFLSVCSNCLLHIRSNSLTFF